MTYIKKPAGTAWSIVAGAVCAALMAPSARADTQYWIDSEVWAAYQRYANAVGSTRPGAFAITEDGHSFWYVKCRTTRCAGSTTYRHDAKHACEKEYSIPCIVFALRQEILVEYAIRP